MSRTDWDPDKRLSALFIVPSLRRAGAENQLVDMVNGLSPREFDKHLLCYREDVSLNDKIDREHVNLHVENRRSRFDWSLVRKIAEAIDAHDIDVVHCTLQNALLYGYAAILRSKRAPRLVVAIHTTINVSWKYELSDRFLYQFLLRRVDEVWFVCEAQRRHWQQKFSFLRDKACVIYNGVDTNAYRPSGRIPGTLLTNIPGDAVVISCIAGFRPEKGHEILIRAFASIAASLPQLHLVLAGDGPTRDRAETLASRLGLRNRIHFPGQVSDVTAIVKRSVCTVLASTAVETFSIAMLESMSMGVPVVATDIGGAAEAINDGQNGYLVEPRNERALASALERLATQPEVGRRLGQAARRTVVANFDTANMTKSASRRLLALAQEDDRSPSGIPEVEES